MFFKKRRNYLTIDKMYKKIVVLSRNKKFYVKLNVPDTIDGRFDMLLLFTIAVFFRLSKINPDGKILAQKLFDRFFMDLDYSLRELGVGDVGVSLKIKNMISAYLGRQKVYCNAFNNNNLVYLVNSLNNNVFRNTDIDKEKTKSLALYCFLLLEKLNNYKNTEILSGDFQFPKLNI